MIWLSCKVKTKSKIKTKIKAKAEVFLILILNLNLNLDNPKIMCYILAMRCKICQNEFIPSKYHPRQEVCSQTECQRVRQIQNERQWRLKNPDYFKCLGQEPSWRENRHRYSRLWKSTHKDYLKEYGQSYKEKRQEYMREYMRRYRLTRNVNRDKS